MRIVFLARALDYGGAERQLVVLARGLHDRGHDIRVAVFYPNGALEPDLRAAGIPVDVIGKRHRWDFAGFSIRLARTLLQTRPEIVHGYLDGPNIMTTLLAPIHRGTVVWGLRASDMRPDGYHWISKASGEFERALSRVPALVIVNSWSGRDVALARGFRDSTMRVIPNGIDLERFRFDQSARDSIRHELGLTDANRLIGRVGRIVAQKDYPAFLQMAKAILEREPRTRFACVGDGTDEIVRSLKYLADEFGIADTVHWLGTRGDMSAIYSAMDIHVSSSAFGEGTPNVVAESMACGVPNVVTDVGDSAITVGELGIVTARGDHRALADGVLRMLDRLEHGEVDRDRIRGRIVEHFSIESLLDRTERELLAIANPNAAVTTSPMAPGRVAVP